MTPLWGADMSRPGKARSWPRTPKGPADETTAFHFRAVMNEEAPVHALPSFRLTIIKAGIILAS
jgi:hypothetical protein